MADLCASDVVSNGWYVGSAETLTAMTVDAPVDDSRLLTSVRMTDAVLACSSANPLWTSTDDDTPGKSVLSRFSIAMLTSVKSDKLIPRERQNHAVATKGSGKTRREEATHNCVGSVP